MIYLYRPYLPEEAIQKISESLEKHQLIYGENCKNFESEFSKYLGIKHSLAVSSGTAALHLALLALEIKQGDYVFLPDSTWPSTVNVVEIIGAKPIFIDVSLENHCMDLSKLEETLERFKNHSGKKVVMPVHQHGHPMNLTQLNQLKKNYNLLLVEDAACAIGSTVNDKKAGTFSDISCFSFHPRKVLTTGEGGMVCTDNDIYAENLRRYLNHGFKADMTDFKFPGLNYRMTETQAILGSFGLKELDDRIDKRRKFKDEYFNLLSRMDDFSIPENSPGHNWQTFLVFPNKKINRSEVLEMMNKKGINAIRGTYSLISLEFYKNKYGDQTDLDNSKYLDKQAIALPFSEDYGPEEAKKVVTTLQEAIQ